MTKKTRMTADERRRLLETKGCAIWTGTARQVGNGTAYMTVGGLTVKDLVQNRRGKWVSKRRHEIGLERAKNLAPFRF